MMKVIDTSVGSHARVYVAAYILNEAGIAAATNGRFITTWNQTPDSVAYSSVFIQDVDQTALIGASAGNSTTSGAMLTTASLPTKAGDIVIYAATCGKKCTYTVNNGFTKAIEHSMTASDGVDGYKFATGVAETPSVTHSTKKLPRNAKCPSDRHVPSKFEIVSNCQVLIGFVVQNFRVTQYSITATAGPNGSINPRGAVLVNYGASRDFNAIPNIGYEVNEWFLDGNSVQAGGTTYTLSNITANHTVSVTFRELVFAISGYVLELDGNTPVEGVLIQANDINSVTDPNGFYELWVDYGWSGRVTPAKYAYAFEPNSRYYEDVNEDYIAGQDYTGTLLTYRITGCIKNDCNVPIEGVLVDANNGGGQGTSDVNGFYEVWVDYAWSGTVTPTKAHYTFDSNRMDYVCWSASTLT
jgi:hypothetical protein